MDKKVAQCISLLINQDVFKALCFQKPAVVEQFEQPSSGLSAKCRQLSDLPEDVEPFLNKKIMRELAGKFTLEKFKALNTSVLEIKLKQEFYYFLLFGNKPVFCVRQIEGQTKSSVFEYSNRRWSKIES